MAVKVVEKKSGGKTHTGKFVDFKEGSVILWSGVMSDKKGGWRGCGKKVGTFPAGDVTVTADDAAKETKRR
ncbi:MAG: hypothetical protein HY687_05480 [Chloroflexi bacterium]|nr:hypothetical protein [Chloroflexota bacterium]